MLFTLESIAEDISGSRVIIFCDNLALCYSMLALQSSNSDLHNLVSQMHLWFISHHVRWWIEWVDSGSNPADGPSREGVADPWCASFEIPVQCMHQHRVDLSLTNTLSQMIHAKT
eukprot:6702141-Karenia_brevis.AAC.1